uniref:Uncharacterized protein n=1 Tax=Cucumis melo TaxID=3656 RepID=A0A9I9DA68_CUCME
MHYKKLLLFRCPFRPSGEQSSGGDRVALPTQTNQRRDILEHSQRFVGYVKSVTISPNTVIEASGDIKALKNSRRSEKGQQERTPNATAQRPLATASHSTLVVVDPFPPLPILSPSFHL